MGYSLKREHVINHEDILNAILTNVKKGVETKLEPNDAGDVSYWQYKVHTILKSAEVFRDIEGGKYAGLRNLVTVKIDTSGDSPAVFIVPKIRVTKVNDFLLSAGHFTEKDLLEDLRSRPLERALETRPYEFYPTEDFDRDTLIAQAKELDWRLGQFIPSDDPDGPVSVVAMDISTGEDFLEARAKQQNLMRKIGFQSKLNNYMPQHKNIDDALDEEFGS